MYKITFFVPESHVDKVKEAMFAAGAGRVGNYDCCAWQIKGQGQFRALAGSNAYVGELNQLEIIGEFRVELVCEDNVIKQTLKALIESHPYETPAYDVLKVVDIIID